MRQSSPNVHSLPIAEGNRECTDIFCAIIGILFAIALLVVAIIFFNQSAVEANYFNFSAPGTIFPAGVNTYPTSNDYYGFRNAFWCTILTAFGLGLIWLAWVHLFPKIAPHTALLLGALSLIALGVVTLVVSSNYFNNHGTWKIIVAVVCFLLALIFIIMFCVYTNALRIQGIFLDYARQFLMEVPGTFAYMFIFFLCTVGLVALFIFQHLAFASKGVSSNNYYNFASPGLLGILNIIEFIWGFQFLRDAFNFCVSGAAVNWYWLSGSQQWWVPLVRLFTRHFGSVALGSFINGFFELPTLIIEFFTCHNGSCCSGIGATCDQKCWSSPFNLVRTDPYGYINFSGRGFCPSAL